MKIQYLGDSKDSFKWDYHDYLMRRLGHPVLNLALMMTEPDGTEHGTSNAEDYPASDGVLDLCRKLRKNPVPELLRDLPRKTGARYSVELHKIDSFSDNSRNSYFQDFNRNGKQVIFVDPDTGFEPKNSCTDAHVKFSEINQILAHISKKSVVSVFQDLIRKNPNKYFRYIQEKQCAFSTSIYWRGRVMFVQISKSMRQIGRIKIINKNYCKSIELRSLKFSDKIQVYE